MIRRGAVLWRRVWAPAAAGLFFVAVVLGSSYGPLIDHHYAERLPFHAHLAASGYHVHTYLTPHSHPAQSDGPADLAAAIVNGDGLSFFLDGAGSAHNEELTLRSALEPPVGLEQPVAYLVPTGRVRPAPPDRPPRTSV